MSGGELIFVFVIPLFFFMLLFYESGSRWLMKRGIGLYMKHLLLRYDFYDLLKAGKFDQRAVKPALKALRSSDEQVRERGMDIVLMLGDDQIVEPCMQALEDRYANVRWKAAKALGKFKDPRAFEPLMQAMADKESSVRREAAVALGKFGDARAVKVLKQALEDPSHDVQSMAREALMALGVTPEQLPISSPSVQLSPVVVENEKEIVFLNMEEWLDQLKHPDWQVRWKAVEALSQYRNPRILDALIEALHDKDWSIRLKAVEALSQYDDSRIITPVAELLTDEQIEIRKQAAALLEKFGGVAVPQIVPALGHANMNVRKLAADILKKIGAPAVDYLVKALESKDGDVQWRAVDALGAIGDARAVKALVQILNDDDADVRLRAVEVLNNLGWKPKTDQERLACLIAAQQWEKVVAIGAPAVPILLNFTYEKELLVREQIKQTLTQICATVDTVAFGEYDIPDLHRQTILRNLDAAELSVPLSALKTVIVQTDSYDFHLIERFITYAINSIGQEYLKEFVEVHLYGNPENLHENLLNNFKHLCKRLRVYEKEEEKREDIK